MYQKVFYTATQREKPEVLDNEPEKQWTVDSRRRLNDDSHAQTSHPKSPFIVGRSPFIPLLAVCGENRRDQSSQGRRSRGSFLDHSFMKGT